MTLDTLLLRDFRPNQTLVQAEHLPVAARTSAIDAHCHLGRWLSDWVGRAGEWMVPDVDSWLEDMERRNVRAFVNLDGRWGSELDANLDRFDARHPGRFATFAHMDWSILERRDSDRGLVAHVEAVARAGAAGIKIWKDLGLHQRDATGALVLPDDPRLEGMWSAAGAAGLPIWWHVADPVAFFEPVDERNENVEMLVRRPDWSLAKPGLPSFRRLIDAMETVVARHPSTTFVAVHAGCYAENLGWVSSMLDRYPNLSIDISARLAQLGRQPRATRALIQRHPDRVLFGTDQIPHGGSEYVTYFRFLETADESFPHDDEADISLGRWRISGIHLTEPLLRRVYRENAEQLVPRLARS